MANLVRLLGSTLSPWTCGRRVHDSYQPDSSVREEEMHLGKQLVAILMGTMLVTAVGCADGADLTGPRLAPDGPAYDGIGWAGSGNRTDSVTSSGGGIGWTGSGSFVVVDSATAGAVVGSGWAGSGN